MMHVFCLSTIVLFLERHTTLVLRLTALRISWVPGKKYEQVRKLGPGEIFFRREIFGIFHTAIPVEGKRKIKNKPDWSTVENRPENKT